MRFTATLPSGVRPKINEFWKYNSRKDEALFFWNEDKKCYRFSLGRVENAAYVDGGVKLVAGEYVEHGGLSGPASKLDRTMVYPCVRLRCQVPCPCATCRRFSVPRVNKATDMHNVKDSKSTMKEGQVATLYEPISENNNSKNKDLSDDKVGVNVSEFEDHVTFHKAPHTTCKFCMQYFHVIPVPKFIVHETLGSGICTFKKAFPSYEFVHAWHGVGPEQPLNLSCENCGSKFKNWSDLRRHMKAVHFKEKFKCDCANCGVSFTRRDNLLKHLEVIHDGGKEKFRCETCNKIFINKFNFDVHSNNSNPVPCKTCSVVCCTKKQLDIHKKIAHPQFQCLLCGKYFPRKADLERHVAIKSKKKTVCMVCSSSVCTSKELKLHVEAAHEHNYVNNEKITSAEEEGPDVKTQLNIDMVEVRNNQYECDQCTYKTTRKFDLKRHKIKKHSTENTLDIETNPAEKKTCPHCFKMFCNSNKVRHHIKTMHDKCGRQKCELCTKTFASKTSLDYHNRSCVPKTAPIGEKKDGSIQDIINVPSLPKSSVQKCHLCKQIIHGGHLRRHLEELHSKTKINTDMIEVSAYPHKCDQCSYSTKRKHDLKRHTQQKHSECDVSFVCEQCGKNFQYELSVRRHKKNCTGGSK